MSESLRQLRHVLALCEHCNYRRAAQALSLTQSALSVSIRRLEEAYGVPLFIRGKRGVVPTEFGDILARAARQTLSTLDEARREIELSSNLESGQVVIGSDPWMADCVVAPALVRLLRKHPKLRFRLRTHSWDELQEDLLARIVDVYVGSPIEPTDPGLCTRGFTLSSPVVICRRDHPLVSLPTLYIQDVLPFPLLVPKLPQWYLNWLGEQFSTGRSSEELHNLFLRAEDLTVIRRIVRDTDAVTASLVDTLPADLSPDDFAMLHIADLAHVASPGIIATVADRPIPEATQSFIDEVMVEITSLTARLDRSRGKQGAVPKKRRDSRRRAVK